MIAIALAGRKRALNSRHATVSILDQFKALESSDIFASAAEYEKSSWKPGVRRRAPPVGRRSRRLGFGTAGSAKRPPGGGAGIRPDCNAPDTADKAIAEMDALLDSLDKVRARKEEAGRPFAICRRRRPTITATRRTPLRNTQKPRPRRRSRP